MTLRFDKLLLKELENLFYWIRKVAFVCLINILVESRSIVLCAYETRQGNQNTKIALY